MHINQIGKNGKLILLYIYKKYTLITNCNGEVNKISHTNVIRTFGLKEKIIIILNINVIVFDSISKKLKGENEIKK